MSKREKAPPGADAYDAAALRLNARRTARRPKLREVAAHLAAERIDIAQRELSAYLAANPDDADALNLQAQIAARGGRRREAAQLLARSLELAPDAALVRFNYADLLFKLNEYDRASEQIEHLLAGDPHNALFRQFKANILEITGDNEGWIVLGKELAEENPNRSEAWVSLGHAYRAAGRQEDAASAYRKAIALRPSSGFAWWSLANMKTARFGDDEIGAMQEQLKRTDIAQDDRIQLQFSLGKAHEDRREFEKSFEQYMRANAAMRVSVKYDPDTLSNFVAANKALFTREFFAARAGWGAKAPDPVFILGRPRSGSTLLEQILSSHSAVEGTAELPYITALAGRLENREGAIPYGAEYLKTLAKLDAAELARLGEEFIADTRKHRKTGRPFFIDKKPANVSHVGLIHLILPNAKIIDARRHPAASAFSMFRQYSSKGRLRLAELGRFYRDYVELMAHFDKVLPGRVHRVIYEEMVADPETETRRLLDYLGLPFEDSCLRFYETKRMVLTPSAEQVRKPISSDAVDHWRNFEPWLGQLVRSLGSAMSDYPKVPEELR